MIGQIVIAILAYFLLHVGSFDTTLAIPFTEWTIDLDVFYVAFLIFWLVGFSNAVNLTDGLDGLVAGTASIAFAAFGVIALFQSQADIALFSFAVTGALLGFYYLMLILPRYLWGYGVISIRWCIGYGICFSKRRVLAFTSWLSVCYRNTFRYFAGR